MKIAILSDTHSRYATVEAALQILQGRNINFVIHCGDIEDSETVWLFQGFTAHFVFGNCDLDRASLRQAVHGIGETLHEPFGSLELEGVKIAFLHGAHASDHHLVAFAKSNAPGFHHCSWDVGSLHDVGLGAEQMRDRGYSRGWGVGRHVLGSNYFYYVRDPWGSYSEYSYDIDFIPADLDWPAADHPPEDSFYVWGPPVPEDFLTNFEAAPRA